MAAPFGGENSIVIFIEILLKLLKKYKQLYNKGETDGIE